MSQSSDEAPRTALVTGASSGFGAAVARAFGARGWSVAARVVTPDGPRDLGTGCEGAGREGAGREGAGGAAPDSAAP